MTNVVPKVLAPAGLALALQQWIAHGSHTPVEVQVATGLLAVLTAAIHKDTPRELRARRERRRAFHSPVDFPSLPHHKAHTKEHHKMAPKGLGAVASFFQHYNPSQLKHAYAYDSVTLSAAPSDPEYVLAYIDGDFANVDQARRDFPNAKILTISVHGAPGADYYDVEAGDLTFSQAVQVALRETQAGRVPGFYCSRDNFTTLIQMLRAAGVRHYRRWSAHYGAGVHICSPHSCGWQYYADGTQFTQTADGRNLDESLILVPVFLNVN